MKVDDTSENADRCVCPDCPTYDGCMREAAELLYCARGVTPACVPKPRGCTCSDCPVWSDYDLGILYFCTG